MPAPLSLYLHIPWCLKKCPYCDFNSHQAPVELNEDSYIDALLEDLKYEISDIAERELVSIFIGGGTPSLFSAASIRRLLLAISQHLPCKRGMEITLEANPGTLEAGRYEGYREAGVNRLSIGIQSFDRQSLERLGRVHSSIQAQIAVKAAKAAGFDRVNLDLMVGLPHQTESLALTDIQRAIELRPDHISYYQLTLEPNTAFYANPPALPNEDRIWEMQMAGQRLLTAAGYRQYEISAYALSGHECRHNLNYWRFGDYLGIGAGAHGKIMRHETGETVRRWRVRGPHEYIRKAGNGSVISGGYKLTEKDLILEYMVNTLRLTEGFTTQQFQQRTNVAWEIVHPMILEAQRRELLEKRDRRIRPTRQGQRFLNNLLELFIL